MSFSSRWQTSWPNTHHPVGSGLYYEDQKKEARRRADDFLENRAPKFLGYFERVLSRNARGDRYLAGAKLTYADLSMFQIIAGLSYAFPRAMARAARKHRKLFALHGRVQERPRIAAYLASPRRIPFNKEGIFRHYAELDAP
jgi:glutathione S-transferase